MSRHIPLGRLLALRLLEEEREETLLKTERTRQRVTRDALQAFEEQTMLTSRTLHMAMGEGERALATAAEMELAVASLRRNGLRQRLKLVDARVESAALAWQAARMHRLQVESLVVSARERQRKEALTAEQKAMDGWFLLRKHSRDASPSQTVDESFQRERLPFVDDDGKPIAKQDHA